MQNLNVSKYLEVNLLYLNSILLSALKKISISRICGPFMEFHQSCSSDIYRTKDSWLLELDIDKGSNRRVKYRILIVFLSVLFLRRFLPSLFAILNPCNLRPIPARRVFKRSSTRICISAVCIPSEAKSDIKSWEGWKGGSERESLFDEDRDYDSLLG